MAPSAIGPYSDGILNKVLVDGGYITASDMRYHFFVTDHLGNVRVVVNDAGVVEQVNQFYPYGEATDMGQALPASVDNPYKWGGKEWDEDQGAYDFGARMYSTADARWTTMDPLSEKHFDVSPYTYCSGDPINRFDPDGMFDRKMFWNGVADVLGGVALTATGSAACATTGGIGAALGGTALLVEGISEICGGVTAITMGCVLDAPEEGERRFTPTGIIGTTAQGVDLAVGNEDFDVYNAVNNATMVVGSIGVIKSISKLIETGAIATSEIVEIVSTMGQLGVQSVNMFGNTNSENAANNPTNTNSSGTDNRNTSYSASNSGNEKNDNILWYNPVF